ncbi:putative alcohol dehydrogenase protein [Podospora fimiseda]|uniref:Alcohol dehydrogenase protein n=1 Tax=Podospora fimiseda TaxID=252190 RepID=A0AAN7BVQ7_9PEZI|nr:putative alcohol dehydrogenase protein [Podospora fimiseda]
MSTSTPIPSQMRAQLLTAFNTPYTLSTIPLPSFSSPHDILIRVLAASYCHTDHVISQGQLPPFPLSFPHISCHEFSGEIISLPPNSLSPFKIGDRVGVPGRSFHPCGECFECLSGKEDEKGYSVYCTKALNNGISCDGGFREYAVVDSRQCTPIPEGMDAIQAATLMCAGVTIYGALKKCGLKKGQRVGIIGAGGGLGHLGVQFGEIMGLRVLGVDVADGPLKLAKKVVRDEKTMIVDGRVVEAKDVVTDIGKEDEKRDREDMGLDAVIILPESQKAFDYGIELLRRHGKCVVVSFPENGFNFSARDVVFRDISIVGSLVASNKVLREMIQFAADHDVKASVRTFALSKQNELVVEYLKGEGGKLVIDMTLQDI